MKQFEHLDSSEFIPDSNELYKKSKRLEAYWMEAELLEWFKMRVEEIIIHDQKLWGVINNEEGKASLQIKNVFEKWKDF